MLKAIFATVLGALVGTLVGLDLQTRFHLGMGAWAISGFVGAVTGFLTFKPTEVIAAFKKIWGEVIGWRWDLHGYSAEYRKLWKLRAMWVGLSTVGVVSTIGLVIYGIGLGALRGLPTFPTMEEIKQAMVFIGGISVALGFEVFLIFLFSSSGAVAVSCHKPLSELVVENRRRFLLYFNPIAFCIWVVIGVGLWLWYVSWEILPKIPQIMTKAFILAMKALVGTIKYSATHERFTVSTSASSGAIGGFFLGQSNTILGLLGGAVFGVIFLATSKILSARWARQEN